MDVLLSLWIAIWPNLAANVIWIPIVGGAQIVGQIIHRRHINAKHEDLKEHIENLFRMHKGNAS